MKVKQIRIENYRSIENVVLNIPAEAPLILFGPNNAGKSNILSAIDRILGERWPTSIDMLDSDFYMRDGRKHPRSSIIATFDEIAHRSKYGLESDSIGVEYWSHEIPGEETQFVNANGETLKGVSKFEREKCQSYLIQANRDIGASFSYSSRCSLLKKKDLCERMNIDPQCKQAVAYAYATEIDDMPAFVPELLKAFFSFGL